jgi:hypothetical protein
VLPTHIFKCLLRNFAQIYMAKSDWYTSYSIFVGSYFVSFLKKKGKERKMKTNRKNKTNLKKKTKKMMNRKKNNHKNLPPKQHSDRLAWWRIGMRGFWFLCACDLSELWYQLSAGFINSCKICYVTLARLRIILVCDAPIRKRSSLAKVIRFICSAGVVRLTTCSFYYRHELNKSRETFWTRWWTEKITGSCEHGDEPSGSMNGRESLD